MLHDVCAGSTIMWRAAAVEPPERGIHGGPLYLLHRGCHHDYGTALRGLIQPQEAALTLVPVWALF